MGCKGVGVGLAGKSKKGPAGKRWLLGIFLLEACFTVTGIWSKEPYKHDPRTRTIMSNECKALMSVRCKWIGTGHQAAPDASEPLRGKVRGPRSRDQGHPLREGKREETKE